MYKENILLNVEVKRTSMYRGDWKSAIDETYELSKELNIACSLDYLGQHIFIILPTMTQYDIDQMKSQQLVIGF